MRKRLDRLEGYIGPAELDVRRLSDDELERIVREAGGGVESLRDYSDEELEAIVGGGEDYDDEQL